MFHILLRASGDEYQVQSYKQGQHAEMILQELTPAEYSEEKLRYLVHSTMPDGVRFLLVFLKRKKFGRVPQDKTLQNCTWEHALFNHQRHLPS